jgi:hypothetical protein
MAGTSPAMTPKGVAYASVQPPVFHIQFSKSIARRHAGSRKRRAPSPVFFGEAPGRPVSVPSFLPRANARGMARQVAQPLFFQCPCSLSKTRGASRRATQTSLRSLGLLAASSLLRRAALFVDRLSCSPGFPRLAAVTGAWLTKPRDSRRPSVSQLLAGGSYWPPGGAPAPPGCVLCEARPRAPHPAPPPRRL